MWPVLLDMTKEESMQHLRCLEIDAFSGLVNALRAQGKLNSEKLNLLRETSSILHISQERHKAEIRRVVNDERLNTIAYHVNGEVHCGEEWANEGQRLIPLMPRVAPQTAYSAIADEVADSTSKLNKNLPMPASTERKRLNVTSPTHSIASCSSSLPQNIFRGVETERKRKHSIGMENCVLAQHLMAPPKISKIQQIYRQRSKTRLKEQLVRLKPPEHTEISTKHQQNHQKLQKSGLHKPIPNPKVNPPQNITSSLSSHRPATNIEEKHELRAQLEAKIPKKQERRGAPSNEESLDRLAPRPIPPTSSNSLASSHTSHTATTAANVNASKTITTTDGQKLIVVSTHANHTLSPTPSILQRTLTTIPFKSLAVNPKFRIVPKMNIACKGMSSKKIPPRGIVSNMAKPKMVAMRPPANKKVIPLSNVQVLNSSGFKVLNSKLTHKEQTNTMQGNAKGGVTNLPEKVEENHVNHERLSAESDKIIEISDRSENQGITEEIDEMVEDLHCHEVNGVEKADDASITDTSTDITIQSIDLTGIDDDIDKNNHGNGIDAHQVETQIENNETAQSKEIDINHIEEMEVQEAEDNETIDHVIEDVPREETLVFEEKVDLDSSVYIYDNDNGNNVCEEVIMDDTDDQPLEVLNVVHALDESLPNIKNVRS